MGKRRRASVIGIDYYELIQAHYAKVWSALIDAFRWDKGSIATAKEHAMIFTECEVPASDEQIDALEKRTGLRFPISLRRIFRETNGGRPQPNGYREHIDTNVSECLALNERRGSAWWTYELMVLKQRLVPVQFFPFAVDSGGNCFFVDCSTVQGDVSFYIHDDDSEPFVPLNVSLEEFWSRLTDD